MNTLGNRIREERERRQLTVGALAQRSGLSSSFVGKVERGESTISLTRLRSLAYALGVTVTQLLDGTQENTGESTDD